MEFFSSLFRANRVKRNKLQNVQIMQQESNNSNNSQNDTSPSISTGEACARIDILCYFITKSGQIDDFLISYGLESINSASLEQLSEFVFGDKNAYLLNELFDEAKIENGSYVLDWERFRYNNTNQKSRSRKNIVQEESNDSHASPTVSDRLDLFIIKDVSTAISFMDNKYGISLDASAVSSKPVFFAKINDAIWAIWSTDKNIQNGVSSLGIISRDQFEQAVDLALSTGGTISADKLVYGFVRYQKYMAENGYA